MVRWIRRIAGAARPEPVESEDSPAPEGALTRRGFIGVAGSVAGLAASGVPLALLTARRADAAQTTSTTYFQDATLGAGINYSNESWGCAWGDFNGDGKPDLWASNHKHPESLWRNNGDGTFTDIAKQVDPITKPYVDTHGSTWADVDNRGIMDLIQVTDSGSYWPSPDYFLHNPGDGTAFVDEAQQRNLQFLYSRSRLCTWFDYDNDGHLDLFEPNLRRGDGSDVPSAFFHQNADGTFTDVTAQVGASSTCALPLQYGQLADIAGNGNGRPQILINGELAFGFPQNIWDTTTVPFTDLRAKLGIPIVKHVFDSAVADFRNNGQMDIFTVGGFNDNDALIYDPQTIHGRLEPGNGQTGFTFQTTGSVTYQLFPNFLCLKLTMSRVYIGSGGKHPTVNNQAAPVFTLSPADSTNVGIMPHTPGVDDGLYIGFDPSTNTWTTEYSFGKPSSPAAARAMAGELREAASGGDGGIYLTFIIQSTTAVSNVKGIGFTPNTGYPNVFLRKSGAHFTDQTAAVGLAGTSFGSVVVGDFDNDGFLDIFAVGSRGCGQLPNALWMNNGDGTFRLIPNAGGAVHTSVGHGDQAAVADYNRDGRLDVFVTNGRKPIPFFGPYQLFENICNNGNHWIELHLVGTVSNRDGVGAHVVCTAGTLTMQRDQDNGTHGRAQNWQDIHFGLAQNTTATSITIAWPSGIRQVLTNVAADQVVQVIEPASVAGAVITEDHGGRKQGPVTIPAWRGPDGRGSRRPGGPRTFTREIRSRSR